MAFAKIDLGKQGLLRDEALQPPFHSFLRPTESADGICRFARAGSVFKRFASIEERSANLRDVDMKPMKKNGPGTGIEQSTRRGPLTHSGGEHA